MAVGSLSNPIPDCMFLDGRWDVGGWNGVGCSHGWCRGEVLDVGVLELSGDVACNREGGSKTERKATWKLDNSHCLLFPLIQQVHIYVYLS